MKKTILIHLLLWAIFGFLEYKAYPDSRLLESNIFFVLRMMLYAGMFYYNSLFLFDILFKKKTVGKGLALQALSMLVYGTAFYYLFTYFYFDTYAERLRGMEKEFPNANKTPEQINRARTAIMIIYYMITFFAALFYWLWRRVRFANAATVRMEKEKLEDENEKIRLENMFLRSQINPHFLHNTLNFLYAKSLPLSNELSEGILTLSKVMRYSLQHEEDERGMVLLDKEIEHLKNVIDIHQMRFSNNLEIDLDVKGHTDTIKVIPLVFITLLENAFKHGSTNDEKHPVRIHIEVAGSRLLFHITNRKKKGPKEISYGIGIDNIRRRLTHAYGDDYRFDILDGDEFYEASIEIPV
jgi:two-component system LytT family sensor kinase